MANVSCLQVLFNRRKLQCGRNPWRYPFDSHVGCACEVSYDSFPHRSASVLQGEVTSATIPKQMQGQCA